MKGKFKRQVSIFDMNCPEEFEHLNALYRFQISDIMQYDIQDSIEIYHGPYRLVLKKNSAKIYKGDQVYDTLWPVS